MSPASITLSFNFNLNLQNTADLPVAVEKIQAALASFGAGAAESLSQGLDGAGAALRNIAEANLKILQSGSVPDQGWGSVKDLRASINSLPNDTRRVVLKAIENGGYVTRAEVYEVIGRSTDQSLKGFTKPVNRLMETLKDRSELDADAEPLLMPVYDTTIKTYQQAQGFMVPVQVVSLTRQA
jgi:hypothetical protein